MLKARRAADGVRIVVYTVSASGRESFPKAVCAEAGGTIGVAVEDGKSAVTPKITAWRPIGSPPLSDAEAAARVTRRPENRPANAVANVYRPSVAELQAYLSSTTQYDQTMVQYDPKRARVTGNFAGTTDEIIQWAAWKWGIPEDWIRAQMVVESWWKQEVLGDRQTVSDPLRYPAHSRVAGTSDVFQSLGIAQVKYQTETYHSGAGVEPLRWRSTAFNLDFYACSLRYYFDGGAETWGYDGPGEEMEKYSAGQEWLSLAAHYQPWPWANQGQLNYIEAVKQQLAARPWERPDF